MPLRSFAALLTVAGLLPFFAGALNIHGFVSDWALLGLGDGKALLLTYGKVILAFMSGVLWGFAMRADAPLFLALSVLPALHAVFLVGDNLLILALGFAGILLFDAAAMRAGQAPDWWMGLRIPVSVTVIILLITGSF